MSLTRWGGDLVKTADETGSERRMSHGHHHLQLLCDFPECPQLNLVSSQVWIKPLSLDRYADKAIGKII